MLNTRLIMAATIVSVLTITGCSSKTQIITAPETKTVAPKGKPIKHTICFEKFSAALPSDVGNTAVPHSRHLIINPYTRVLVEGMADEMESFEGNEALGLRRAKVVADTLASLGVDRSQIIVRSSANLRIQSEQKPERNRCVVLSY